MSIPKDFDTQERKPETLYENPLLQDDNPNEQTNEYSLPSPPEAILEDEPAKIKYPLLLTVFFPPLKENYAGRRPIVQDSLTPSYAGGGGGDC